MIARPSAVDAWSSSASDERENAPSSAGSETDPSSGAVRADASPVAPPADAIGASGGAASPARALCPAGGCRRVRTRAKIW